MACLKRIGVRHRPPKECRDTSVTMALQAGADPYYVAAQHGHSLQTMMRDYAAFIPKGDRGRNLAAINAALGNAGSKPDFAEGAQ
jgi:integrase